MKVFTIQFLFKGRSRIANVYYAETQDLYTIYFTDVELILEYGCKVSYTSKEGFRFLKTGKDTQMLKSVLQNHLLTLSPAA
ncbi:MAG: hypothetical protein ACXVLT_11370 [Flavisolibacter sp.]